MEFNMIIKKLSFTFVIVFSFVYLAMSTAGHCDQTAEVEDLTAIRTNFLNDVEKVFGSHEQGIAHLESNLSILKEELKKLNTIKKKLIDDKAGEDVLGLTKRQGDVLEDRINTLDETKRIRVETTEVAGNLENELETTATLSGRKNKINEEASLLPGSQFESFQKEAELLEARLESILAKAREKEAHFQTIQTTNDALSSSLKEQKERLLKEVKELANQEPEAEEESILINNKKHLLGNELKLRDDKINLLFAQTRLAELRSQSVQIQVKYRVGKRYKSCNSRHIVAEI